MIRLATRLTLAVLPVVTLLPGAAMAQNQVPSTSSTPTQSSNGSRARSAYLDLDAGIGYSTNPLLSVRDNRGSAFGRLAARGVYAWRTERSVTSLQAFVENSDYLRKNGNVVIYDLAASTSYAASETLSIYGNLGFSGDFGGQLSSRFTSVPTGPVIVDPAVPPPLTIQDPSLYTLTGRQYRVSGQVGASARVNPRDFVVASVGAQRVFFTGSSKINNYEIYSVSGGYERQLSPRTSIGARVVASRADFRNGESSTSFGPQVYGRTQISEVWDASGSIGVNFTKQNMLIGNDNSVNLSFDGSLCRRGQSDNLCARVSRNSTSAATTDLLLTTSAAIDYTRRLSERDSIQVALSATRYSGLQSLDRNASSTYLSATGSYNRTINGRLSGGVNLLARTIRQIGPDPKTDVGGSVFLRYRLGDLQ